MMRAGSRRGPNEALVFQDDGGIYSCTDAHDRRWRITEVYTGWRLEFRDPGDMTATFAGTHRSLGAAQAEAAR